MDEETKRKWWSDREQAGVGCGGGGDGGGGRDKRTDGKSSSIIHTVGTLSVCGGGWFDVGTINPIQFDAF